MIEQALPGFDIARNVEWEPTRKFALARLARFVPEAGRNYASRRNFDLGPSDRSNVSALSPLIRHRLLLEEEVLRETLAAHSTAEAEKFVQEVIWRAYFKGWLEHRPLVWQRYCEERDRLIRTLESDADLEVRYSSAALGKTGIACFDAWANELVRTGYLHNHARMWFASIWIFTLNLPWELGADFFLRHLLDGDAASNTLSWRWVGGLHTPGKTYLARPDNIERFTQGRFRPGAELAKAAEPLWEPPIGEVVPLAPASAVPTDEPFALLITEEDCHPESLDLPFAPAAVLGWTGTDQRSPLPVGAPAHRFAQGAVEDALERVPAWASPIAPEDIARVAPGDWTDWLRERGLRRIVMGKAPVGPTADTIASRRAPLSEAGISLLALRRPYDELIWPHAQKGFFNLKRKIPDLLRRLGLA
jgi:deoxyribodipyrimidine photo-lyase